MMTRLEVAEALCKAINDELNTGSCWGWESKVWTGGDKVRVYVNSTSRARRKAGHAAIVSKVDLVTGAKVIRITTEWERQRGTLDGIVEQFGQDYEQKLKEQTP